jgi:hypothetical protein
VVNTARLWRRRFTATLALLATAVVILLGAPASPAHADPEDGPKGLRDALEKATLSHVAAKNKLDRSLALQLQLKVKQQQAEAKAKSLSGQVGAVAAKSYRLGRVGPMGMLLNSSSPDTFLQRAVRLDMMAQLDGRALARYREAAAEALQAKQAVDQTVRDQQKFLNIIAKNKKQAENALAAYGGGATTSGFVSANSPLAKPAPRNSDGSWPKESPIVKDPTTSGHITPRLLHAYQEAQLAGFKHYTSCFSVRATGEHPKGRACDFAAAPGGFENVNASGADKAYGTRLAAFFVKNADRLGVMYVIWYRQIWMPGTGWKSYSGKGGPAGMHTNHVHLSVL